MLAKIILYYLTLEFQNFFNFTLPDQFDSLFIFNFFRSVIFIKLQESVLRLDIFQISKIFDPHSIDLDLMRVKKKNNSTQNG